MAPALDTEILDDPERLESLDPRGTLRALATAGAQVRRSTVYAQEAGIERLGRGERPRGVLIASLGGSGIVSEILDVLAEPASPVSVTDRRNAPLPGWVGPLDLVIAVSLSGRARGPVALAAEAARRGAELLTVGAPDSPLAEVAGRARGVHVPVPVEGLSSRTALWSLLTPVLLAATQTGVIELSAGVLDDVADRLDEQADACRPASESFVNPAKVLAADIAETVPVVLGDGDLTGVAAGRAAAMLARTARMPASHGVLPDAASQIVSCFDGPLSAGGPGAAPGGGGRDIFADPFLDGPQTAPLGLLMLRDLKPVPEDGDPPRQEVQRHNLAQAVVDQAEEAGVKVMEVGAEPGHELVRLAGMVALTDFMSTYIALGLGMDPGTAPHAERLRDATG